MDDDSATGIAKALTEHQTRLAYYLTTISASATALTVDRVEAAKVGWPICLLLLAVGSWTAAFACGVSYLVRHQNVFHANLTTVQVAALHGPAAAQPSMDAASEHSRRGASYARWQTRCLVLGAVAYVAWVLIEKVGG